MRTYVQTVMVMLLLAITKPSSLNAQCAPNMGFDNGTFSPWSTSTDSNFITPGSRRYYKPGKSPIIASYGSTDAWLGTISKPNAACGNYLTRIGNKGVNATADTVYRTYIIDSLSDKLTIYSKGVVELAHNYWNVATIEAPGFGYEVYVNGKKLDCLKGAFFCGNVDKPYVWNVGTYKDTSTVRKSVGWAKEVLNFACFVGDTVEVRLFTRDCILLGHYAYAYFDVLCGDTSKPVISKIMVNDIIDVDKLNLYCNNSTTLYLKPNTSICPIVRSNVNWTPTSMVIGASNLDSAKVTIADSAWVYAEANFSNFCTTVHVRDSIFIKVLNKDPHNNIPKMPRNYCDCYSDTLDFGTTTVTNVTDQNGNSMSLTSGLLILKPCDNFFEESFWKSASAKIKLRKSQIGATSWVSGNSEGAIGQDSILATGTIRYDINYGATKKFYAGINNKSTSNGNDMTHSILYNAGSISVYYAGTLLTSLGAYAGNITVDFKTLSTNKVEIWINGVKKYAYSNFQKATFPSFADFSAQGNDTALINKTSIFGPTKNIKDFTRLMVPTTFKYFISYNDRCGVNTKDTIKVIPGFTSSLHVPNNHICGLTPVNISVTSPYIMDDVYASTNGDGYTTELMPNVTYTPVTSDFGSPVSVLITSVSGRCNNPDTAILNFDEIPYASAGPDISSPPATFVIGGTPSGACSTCGSIKYAWSPKKGLNDSTFANPIATKSQVTSTYFALNVSDPLTGCFSRDTMIILTPLPLHQVAIETNCTKDNTIEFNWSLVPTEENFTFGIEYSLDNGNNWLNAGSVQAEKESLGVEIKQYQLTVEKMTGTNTLYRFYSLNITGHHKNIIPVDIDCATKTVYTVYPNPFTGTLGLGVKTSNISKSNMKIQIFNQFGQEVFALNNLSNPEYNNSNLLLEGTEHLAQGIYFLQVSTNENIVYKTKVTKMN